ncbi:MAG: hypothetical protein WCO44_03295 [Bacteroidota bacterium]
MSLDPVDNDLIEKYLLGNLSDAEVRSFEARLGDDREFARKYRLMKTFPEMMSEAGKLEYEKKFTVVPEILPEKKKIHLPKSGYFVWGAIFIAFVGISVFVFNHRSSFHPDPVTQEEQPAETTGIRTPAPPQHESTTVLPAVDNPVETAPEVIELVDPADGIALTRKDDILFNWKQKTDSFTNFYIYSEVQDKMVFWRGIKPGIREYRVPIKFLRPGKFYWYVGTKDVRRTFTISE